MKYVIERMNKETREWWTGSGWSDVDVDAKWFDSKEQAIISLEDDPEGSCGTVTGFEVTI